MLHIALHFVVPVLVAWLFYRDRVRVVALLWATMLVDLDHLLAQPIYDPERCSIGFHPLHSPPAIALYWGLCVFSPLLRRWSDSVGLQRAGWMLHLVGLGLVMHMALDGSDCLVLSP